MCQRKGRKGSQEGISTHLIRARRGKEDSGLRPKPYGVLSPFAPVGGHRHPRAAEGGQKTLSMGHILAFCIRDAGTGENVNLCLRIEKMCFCIEENYPSDKRKSTDFQSMLSFFGAADEARTRYLHLGKVALYQMSYSRILWCLRAESLSLRRKPRRLKQFTELFLRAAFRFRKRKRKIGASGRNRTTDTGIFSPLLYRLSYRGICCLAKCLFSIVEFCGNVKRFFEKSFCGIFKAFSKMCARTHTGRVYAQKTRGGSSAPLAQGRRLMVS